jgi:osmotically inducible protein OsmC
MVRKGRAVWRGTGKDGTGDLTTDSGVLSNTPYSFRTRFESEPGTNPEELIAAALLQGWAGWWRGLGGVGGAPLS